MAKEPAPRGSRTQPTPREKNASATSNSPAANGKSAAPAQRPAEPEQRLAGSRPKPRPLYTMDQMMAGRGFGAALREFLKQSPSWLTSMVVHVAVLLVLGLMMLPEMEVLHRDLISALAKDDQQIEELENDPLEELEEINIEPSDLTSALETPSPEVAPDIPSPIPDLDAAPPEFDPRELGDLKEKFFEKAGQGLLGGEGVQGRGGAARQRLLYEGGGTQASEEAVARALKWLAEHQLPDGSWSFDHRLGQCGGRCRHAGNLSEARFGATGLALMSFLGAGQTHKEGDYKKNVFYGLQWITQNMNRQTGQMYRQGGRMYAHGIATIALCEACGMTDDRTLLPYCRKGIEFLIKAQNRNDGGWRYHPGDPGDTSVVGWQLMALKSAKWAYIKIPPNTIKGVTHFLNGVQSGGGAQYGYKTRRPKASTTAVGLLCRMYLGWKKDNPALVRGVQYLSQTGPSRNDVYYNYYAAQVMRHWDGPLWKKWNDVLREYLIQTQEKQGHENGSWYFNGPHGPRQGGRHYTTCMCCMTLEVYYRHLPLYRTKAAEDQFDE